MAGKRKHLLTLSTWTVVSLFVVLEHFLGHVFCYIPVEYMYSEDTSSEQENGLPGLQKIGHTAENRSRFSGSYHGELYTSYASSRLERLANLVDMNQMLSYETAWTSGKRVTTFVKVKQGRGAGNSYSQDFPQVYGLDSEGQNLQTNDPSSFSNTDMKSADRYAFDKMSSQTSFRNNYDQYQDHSRKRRRRREVYGRDDRFFIPGSTFGQREPFSYSVRISTGCTGILVSPRHVLTAAHCVHDQSDYVDGFRELKVGFVKGNGVVDWVRVRNVRISKGWIEGGQEAGPYFDYALLKLRKEHGKPYINITVSQGDTYKPGERIYFTSFEDDKPSNTLWYRSCVIEEEDSNFLYHFCDAQPGSSGSGVYAWRYDKIVGQWTRNVIGVFSGNRWKIYDDWFLRPKQFNVAVRFSPSKYVQICKWLGSYAEKECLKSSGNFYPL